jgi:hypothetical protein
MNNESKKTFYFHKDEKFTIWYRGTFEVEANSLEEAKAKVIEMEKNEDYKGTEFSWKQLDDTLEAMTPEDNGGCETVEIRHKIRNDPFYTNAPE